MSYEIKISNVKEIIDSHNKASKKLVDFDKFLTNLQDAGGTTDEALKCCTWEDLEKFGLPTLLAKQVATTFRVKSKKPVTESAVQIMSSKELVDNYDVRNYDNFVGKRLLEVTKGKPCLIFNGDGSLNRDASAYLVEEIRDGYPPRENFIVNEKPHRVFSVGSRPDQFAFENPLYPGSLLRPDETCSYTNRSWSGVDDKIRVLLYLAVKETKELKITSIDSAHAALDFATTVEKVANRYVKAAILYGDLEQVGKLPTLKLLRSSQSNDPFYSSHKKF